jgi:hypothetical protein
MGVSAACAADSAKTATSAELVAAIRNAKILDPSFKLSATVSGDEVLVNSQRKPKSSDNECKIQAVLIGKTVFDLVPNDCQRAKVMFFNYDADSYSEVSVRRAEVRLFGAGQLSEKDLLASLELKTTNSEENGAGNLEVAPGPMQPARMIALGRIQRLKLQGTNVTPFESIFGQIEDAAKKNDLAGVRNQLPDLNAKLKEQEQLVRNAQDSEKSLQAEGPSQSRRGQFGSGSWRRQIRPGGGFGLNQRNGVSSTYGSGASFNSANSNDSSSGRSHPAGSGNQWNGKQDQNGSSGSASGGSNQPSEKYVGHVKETTARITERIKTLKEHGYPVTYYTSQMQTISNMFDAKNYARAREELDRLDSDMANFCKEAGLAPGH